jgi:hypothetical protein
MRFGLQKPGTPKLATRRLFEEAIHVAELHRRLPALRGAHRGARGVGGRHDPGRSPEVTRAGPAPGDESACPRGSSTDTTDQKPQVTVYASNPPDTTA